MLSPNMWPAFRTFTHNKDLAWAQVLVFCHQDHTCRFVESVDETLTVTTAEYHLATIACTGGLLHGVQVPTITNIPCLNSMYFKSQNNHIKYIDVPLTLIHVHTITNYPPHVALHTLSRGS